MGFDIEYLSQTIGQYQQKRELCTEVAHGAEIPEFGLLKIV